MIRPTSKEDVATIIAIAEKSWVAAYRDILSVEQYDYMIRKFYSPEALQQTMEEQAFLLCYSGGEATGFAAYQLNYPAGGYCKIHKLYVLPDVHGTGTGRKLVHEIAKIAGENQCTRLTLNVNKYNKALGFYEKMGFRVERPEVIDIGRGYVMDDFVMELPL